MALDLSQFWMTDKPFHYLTCPYLVSLDLTGCLQIGDGCVMSLSENCPNLLCLKMNMCNNLTDLGCSYISKLAQLEILSFRTGANISDTGVLSVTKGCTNLKSLSLNRAQLLTSRSLSNVIRGLTSLTSLKITYCPNLSDELIFSMTENSETVMLENLSIEGDRRLRNPQFCRLSRLRKLKLKHTNVGSLECIHRMKNLTALTLGGSKRLVDVSPLLSVASQLISLVFVNCKKVSSTSLEEVLLASTSLRRLNIFGCISVSFTDVQLPSSLPLEELNIGYTKVLPDSYISCISSISVLVLEATLVSDSQLFEISGVCHKLETLNLQECSKITNDGLVLALPCLRSLKHLVLSKCKKLGEGLVVLSSSLDTLSCCDNSFVHLCLETPSLKVLDLSRCTRLLFSTLCASFENLRHLWLVKTNPGSDFLFRLQACKFLEVVNLSNVQDLTVGSLKGLLECPRLERIYLNGCKVKDREEFLDFVANKFPYVVVTWVGE
eukprot:TRINITY_DN11913_c0_g1_i1.p1 TRINITY_DN11913_c0_g1~~TRINITY_DN11913_c0_g1_i1.p1  ORF type:complete len:494 (-),score=67.13 TRINITY_DN11913_c0_g1_i1:187-1668(-)